MAAVMNMPRKARPSPGIAGPLLMVLCMGLYVANDALVKILGEALPLGQIISLRGFLVISTLALAVLLLPGHGLAAYRWMLARPVLARAAWDTAVTFLYLFALLKMPIANVLAVMNLSPLVILPLAARHLGERVSPMQWLAVAAGFLGALIVVRPGPEGFNPWAISAFLAMLGVVGRDFATRDIPAHVPSLSIALANVIMVQVAGLMLWWWQGERTEWPPSPEHWIMLLGCALFLGAAYVLIVVVVRIAPMSETAPWRYSIVVWGVVAGWLAFGEWPDAPTLLGMGIILLAALYATLSDLRRNRRSS